MSQEQQQQPVASGTGHGSTAAGLLQALDARLSNRLYRAGASVPRPVWKALEWGGDGFVWLFIALAILLAPGATLQQRTVWANFLAAWLVDLLLVGAIKGTVRRSRPVYNQTKDFLVVVAVDHYSFPSGHSSRLVSGCGWRCLVYARVPSATRGEMECWEGRWRTALMRDVVAALVSVQGFFCRRVCAGLRSRIAPWAVCGGGRLGSDHSAVQGHDGAALPI